MGTYCCPAARLVPGRPVPVRPLRRERLLPAVLHRLAAPGQELPQDRHICFIASQRCLDPTRRPYLWPRHLFPYQWPAQRRPTGLRFSLDLLPTDGGSRSHQDPRLPPEAGRPRHRRPVCRCRLRRPSVCCLPDLLLHRFRAFRSETMVYPPRAQYLQLCPEPVLVRFS